MSYEVLKYILWGLLCLPVLAFGLYCIEKLAGEGIVASAEAKRKIKPSEKRRMDAEKRKAEEAERLRRKKFDEEYMRDRGI